MSLQGRETWAKVLRMKKLPKLSESRHGLVHGQRVPRYLAIFQKSVPRGHQGAPGTAVVRGCQVQASWLRPLVLDFISHQKPCQVLPCRLIVRGRSWRCGALKTMQRHLSPEVQEGKGEESNESNGNHSFTDGSVMC